MVKQLIEDSRQRIEAIAAENGRTWENTMVALDQATEPLDFAMGIVRHLEAVVTTPELRNVIQAVQPLASAFYSSIPLHAGLWKALNEYAATPGATGLAGVRSRYLRKTIESFKRHGAGLDDAGKRRLEDLDVDLSRLTTRFSQNVVDATACFEHYITDEKDLAGLPPSAVAAARHSAEMKGKPGWRFTLQAPSYMAVMTYLGHRPTRELFYKEFNKRAASGDLNNAGNLARILELRQEKAKLLGYANFADLVLEERMAHNGDAARAFVANLEIKTRPAFERENEGLQQFRNRMEGSSAPTLEPWDIGYYAEKQRSAEYSFEDEDLRPYFPMESVVAGLFELVRRLYGVQIVEAPGIPTWHPEVKHYEVRDSDGTLLGTFYADWFPRETKRGGAWMDAFLTGHTATHPDRPHVGLMCGNMTAPLSDRPSLLTHREVETVFHEFGHLLHHLLSCVPVRSLSGTSVPWDFVELPSQIMENWCWERESLDLFARQWQTGERIPDNLFTKMVRARTFRAANAQMRQLGFGAVDFALHMDYRPGQDGDVVSYSRSILQRFTPAVLPPEHAMITAFTHLFSDPVGYGAGYYSYKWSEVLEADAFTRFRQEGIFNAETGRAFRDCILSKGDSEDPADLFRKFMGRDPDPNALLERLGLAVA